MTVQNVIDVVLDSACGGQRMENSCDVLVAGQPEAEVTGIATTFMATVDVLRRAAATGANLIITHEPTYYTTEDDTSWLTNSEDSVYMAKMALMEQHGLSIWRYHDHMHAAGRDQIYDGLIAELGWGGYEDKQYPKPWLYTIPATSLRELALFFKHKLGMKTIQTVGRGDLLCSRVGILVGGGSLGLGRENMPMELMEQEKLDVLVCGEIGEWTLTAYVNDAGQLGMNRGMIVLGHERSEEWGMKHMAHWLGTMLNPLPVHFADAKEPFLYY